MKAIFMKIRKMGLGVNCMPMEIFTLGNFLKIKNMVKAHSIGLIYVKLPASRILKLI